MSVDVLVIGGGPSGLTAAAGLARAGLAVTVLEREGEAGGIPRHSDHPGYGLRDLHRVLRGPAYARRLTADALAAGVDVRTRAMVTGWAGPHRAEVTSPDGRATVSATAVVLATGTRERPRPARLVPGDRPAGVYTTGQLQNLVHLHHAPAGTRAVIVGAELVSWSAVLTLRTGGAKVVAMTTKHAKPESYAAFTVPGRLALRVPVHTSTDVTRVIGRGRVEAVEVVDTSTGVRRVIPCDTVVFTGDWIPDHELARLAGAALDPHTSGPLVDGAQRSSLPGVFAIGNLVHPADTADVAALDGRAVVDAVRAHLREPVAPLSTGVRVLPGAGLRWVTPGLLRGDDGPPPRGRLLSWPSAHLARPTVTATQNGRVLARRRVAWPASPGRVFGIPFGLLSQAGPQGEIVVALS